MRAMLCLVLILAAVDCLADDTSPLDSTDTHSTARQSAEQVRSDIENGRLAQQTDKALAQLIHVAVLELRAENYTDEADDIEGMYKLKYDGFVTRMVANKNRDIGDHKPLIQWLANVMKTLENTIGFATCKALHLTDLDVFNYAIPVAFAPCTFPMDAVTGARIDEYRRHMAQSDKYGAALIPVITYWVIDITCSVVTYGAGWFFICAPVSDAGEWIMEKWIAPKLSDKIYTAACGN